MNTSVEQTEGNLKIALEGDLIGGKDALQFSQALREALAAGGNVQSVVIDVARVEFVNSSGLGMLLSARQSAHDAGAQLSLENPGEQLRSLLEITRLSDLLGVRS